MHDEWWSIHGPHLRSRPPADGLRALARAVAPGSRPVRIRRLSGGLSTATHVVSLERRSGRTLDVVIKRFREFSETCREEWERTVFAQRLPVASPEPIAFDAAGDWFGAPTIVIGLLPGRANVHAHNLPRHYPQITQAILAVASASTTRLPAAMRMRIPGHDFALPDGLRRTPLVDRALRTIARLRPRAIGARVVVGHGDCHPGNMLWIRGRMTGLVDWRSANLQHLTREVVYCRTELAVLFGAREADRFVEVFERESGSVLDDLRCWDLMQGLTAMRWVAWWAHGYREMGRTDLTEALAKRRAVAVVRRALRA